MPLRNFYNHQHLEPGAAVLGERNFSGTLLPVVFVCCLSLFACRASRQDSVLEGTPLIVYISAPGTAPKDITFEYERSDEDVKNLKVRVESLKKGDFEADVVKLLGPPNRQGSSAPKGSTKITDNFYLYDVRIVKRGTSNIFDQQLSFDFDPGTGKLLRIESTVPEIR